MKFSGTLAPLAVCAVRDAVLYHERLLQSETLRNRADYEEHTVNLSVFLDEIQHQYKKIEAGTGLPLAVFFDADVPVPVYHDESSDRPDAAAFIQISSPYALLMVSSVRDAILYRKSLLGDDASRENSRDQKEYLTHLEELLAFVKDEYKNIESKVGIPLEKILHSSYRLDRGP